jgi:regulator of RNase E activity RraB
MNDDSIRYALYVKPNDLTLPTSYFSDGNVEDVKKIIENRLFKHFRKSIIVPKKTIVEIMNNVYHNRQSSNVGDIYSRYIINLDSLSYVDLNEKVINIIVNDIISEIEMEVNNNNLSIWDTVYGDNNDRGLRAHSVIKINKRRPSNNLFNMNY